MGRLGLTYFMATSIKPVRIFSLRMFENLARCLRIHRKYWEVKAREGVLKRVWTSFRLRYRACSEGDEGHFQHLWNCLFLLEEIYHFNGFQCFVNGFQFLLFAASSLAACHVFLLPCIYLMYLWVSLFIHDFDSHTFFTCNFPSSLCKCPHHPNCGFSMKC